jgi:hypothetical protein
VTACKFRCHLSRCIRLLRCACVLNKAADCAAAAAAAADDHSTTTSNASGLPISNDGWFYTNLSTQMVHWRDANNCTGNSTRYTTEYDGTDDLWCVREGHCRNAELDRLSPRRTVVRCSWGGSHHVPGAQDDDLNSVGTPDWWGMKLIWKFFEAHARMLP